MSNCYHYKIVGNDNFDNCLFLVVVFLSYTNVPCCGLAYGPARCDYKASQVPWYLFRLWRLKVYSVQISS